MVSGIYHLIDCSLIQQLKFETVSNNLSNVNTTGFKKNFLSFDQALASSYTTATDFTPGEIKHTGNQLDVALEGDGFFKIETARGVRYTRDGAFSLNNEGYLITRAGHMLVGRSGSIKINPGEVAIGRNGQITVGKAVVDRLEVVDFKDRRQLSKEGANLYLYEGAKEDVFTLEEVNVQQGFLENSNVNPTQEMIKMIEAFRAFESAQKAIQSIDEITSKMVNDYGMLG
jgi:flagellar basal-body rod protein FlgF